MKVINPDTKLIYMYMCICGVVFISDIVALDFENFFLFNEGTYNSIQAYKNSKVAGVMFTYELARRLEGTGVTANCVNPGVLKVVTPKQRAF